MDKIHWWFFKEYICLVGWYCISIVFIFLLEEILECVGGLVDTQVIGGYLLVVFSGF